MSSFSRRVLGASVLAALVVPAAASAQIGSAPLLPRGAVVLGSLNPARPLTLDLVLSARDPQALTRFATAVNTPGNALYGHYLRRGQFGVRFGATSATIAGVQRALAKGGLPRGTVAGNRLSIQLTAPAGAIARALHVDLRAVRLADGRVAFANLHAPILPGVRLLAVIGLNDLYRERSFHTKAIKRATSAPTAPGACPAADAVTPSNQGAHANGVAGDVFLPGDRLEHAYGVSPIFARGLLGQGTTTAIYELEGNFPGDVAPYESCFGMTGTVTTTQIDGGPGDPSPANQDGLETQLDVDAVLNMAPATNIVLYQGPNTGPGAYDTYSAIVNDDTAQVISSSWGLAELIQSSALGSGLTGEAQLFEQAASQGQSMVAASGDSGSEDVGLSGYNAPVPAVDDPASQPFVTGAGGTRLTLDAHDQRAAETVWNDGPALAPGARGAGGGGISTQWGMPSWQYSTLSAQGWLSPVPSAAYCPGANTYSADSGQLECRMVPDVTANADPASGYVVYYNGTWTHVGGTSGAAPTWAGLAALADSCRSAAGREPLGNLNQKLYAVAATHTYGTSFFDVKSGNNDYEDPLTGTLGYAAAAGYDAASGLGAPGSDVINALCS